MIRERRFSLIGGAALLVALPLGAGAQTAPTEPKVFFACYGSLTGVVYRIKEPGLPTGCLHRTHVQFSWTSGTGGAALTDHGALQGLGNDNHPQYLLVDGTRALTGALSAGGNKLTNLAAATAAGEAVRYEQAVKSGDAASGDLSGTYPAPTVAKLQNTDVSSTAPTSGQVLAFDGLAWKPTAAPSGGASGAAVRSLNGLADEVTLAAGTNITITPAGQTLTINATPRHYMALGAIGAGGGDGEVLCSPGDIATGGGVRLPGGGTLISSYPVGTGDARGWHGTSFGTPVQSTVYVICLDSTP